MQPLPHRVHFKYKALNSAKSTDGVGIRNEVWAPGVYLRVKARAGPT
jgi:hypothetical protein